MEKIFKDNPVQLPDYFIADQKLKRISEVIIQMPFEN